MGITLAVNFVSQLGIGGHVPMANLRDDPTGCWYASACMVAYYFEAGPRMGVPELFKKDLGSGQTGHFATGSADARRLAPNHHDLLAQRESLEPVPHCEEQDYDYTSAEIESLLTEGGPIFLYWMKTSGSSSYGHASVVIGIEGDSIIYHDPENAPNSRMTVDNFNAFRQRWRYALMQRKK